MRLLTWLFLAAFFLPTQSAKAKYFDVFTSGDWTGTAYYDDDTGNFKFCTINGTYRSGITLFIALYPEGKWELIFSREGGFPAASGTRFDLFVDNRFVFSGSAESRSSLLVVPIPLSDQMINGMINGRELKVVSPYGASFFSLKGTKRAITQLYHCVKDRQGQAARDGGAFGGGAEGGGGGAPGGAPGGGGAGGDGRGGGGAGLGGGGGDQAANLNQYKFTRDQVLTYVIGFLSEAGLDNYKILDHEETKAFGDVVWQYEDGTVGSIVALKSAPGVKLEEVAAAIIKDDAANCKGDFASGKKAPKTTNGTEVHKVVTSCRAGDKSFSAEYSVARLASGAFIRLMTARIGGSAETQGPDSLRVERSEEALLSAAPPN